MLSNKFGEEYLDEAELKLHKKLKEFGIGNIDELQEKYEACAGDSQCEKDVRAEYFQKEREAGAILLAMYEAGDLSSDEFNLLLTDYANAMLKGIQDGEMNAERVFSLLGDIYARSGIDWTPGGMTANPVYQAILSLENITTWRAQGYSEAQIQDKILKNDVLASLFSNDYNKFIEAVNSGVSLDDALRLATLAAVGKVNGTLAKGKGSQLPVPDKVIAKNGLGYQSNSKHTPGGLSNRPNAGIEPKNSLELFENSIQSSKLYPNKEVRFAVDSQGGIHRFEGTNGVFHWNGSTNDIKNPLKSYQIPSDIQKQLGVKIK